MSKISKKWSSEQVIQFLETYEQYPCLWNHKLLSYKDRNKRDDALRKIVEVMSDSVNEFDVNSAKAKIRSIRNAYTLEHHKVLKSYKSGTSTDTIYKPTVSWFPVADRFLKHIVETRNTKNTLESHQSQDVEESQETEVIETTFNNIYAEETAEETTEETTEDSRSIRSLAPSTSKQLGENPQNFAAKKKKCFSNYGEPACKKTKFNNMDSVTQAVNTLKDIANKSNPPQTFLDEYDSFGKTVAAHLRQLPSDTALVSQSDILHYLIQKRLGRRASLSTAMSPTRYNQFTSASHSNSTLCNDLEEHLSTSSEYETSDILVQAWNNLS